MQKFLVQPGNAIRIDGAPALVTVEAVSDIQLVPPHDPVPATPPAPAPVAVSPTSPVTAQVIKV